jgi:ATP-binding cassette, subfamily B, bacterial
LISAARAYFGLLRDSRRLLILSSALSLAQAALVVPIGLLFKQTFDHTIPNGDSGQLVAIGGLLIALALASTGLSLWTRHLVLSATKTAVLELRLALLARIQTLPAAWADRTETGRMHATLVQDSERIDIMSNDVAAQLVPAGIIAIALSVALLTISPLLFALLVPVVPGMLLLTRWLGGVLRRRTRSWHQAFDRFSIRTHFALRARSLVTTSGTEEAELAAARKELSSLRDAGRSMAWMQNAYVQANSLAAMLIAVIVLIVGGSAVANEDMTLGSLISFYALAALLRGQLNTIASVVPEIIAGGESLTRLQDILEADEPQPYAGTRPPAAVLPIVLADVHFGYREGAEVLHGTSLEINAGELVAIVGPNGVGKSTVAALILGLYRPQRGELLAAGVRFDDLDMLALRRRIAVVPEDPILFPGTIAENIAYGSPAPDMQGISEAARRATADRFISTLGDGYGTSVGDEGELLSGGQRQRIAIARALMREPRLLILDEPTTSLDRESVSELIGELSDVADDRAILLISHDSAVTAGADRVHELRGHSATVPTVAGVARIGS